MSTSYAPYCVDCDDEHWLDDCRAYEQLQALVRRAESLVVLGDMLKEIEQFGYGRTPTLFLCDSGRDRVDLSWFAKHAGHKLAVRDEYGGIVGECNERLKCESCGMSQSRCKLPEGHDGPHRAPDPK